MECVKADSAWKVKNARKDKIKAIVSLVFLLFFAFIALIVLWGGLSFEENKVSYVIAALIILGIGGVPSVILMTIRSKTSLDRAADKLSDSVTLGGGCLRIIGEIVSCIIAGIIVVPILIYKNILTINYLSFASDLSRQL